MGVLNSPQDFENLHFYFFGQFEVGDIISIFPDRNCQISKSRDLLSVATRIEVSNDHFTKMLNQGLSVDSGIGLTHIMPAGDIDEGKFFPSVKYIRLVNGEINESECYSFLDQIESITKDTTDPKKPKIIKLSQLYGIDGVARLEVYSDSDGGQVNFYKNGSCDEADFLGSREFGVSSC